MINITFPDGAVRQYEKGVTAMVLEKEAGVAAEKFS